MTSLRPMPKSAFASYLTAAIASYAEENIAAGRWPRAGALERSREDFESLLPRGLDTPGQFLYEVVQDDGGPAVVGVVWLALETKHGACTAYVYDLEVRPEHRRQGHALQALKMLERLAAEFGAESIGLNVFAFNHGAQALYRKLGFEATNINLRKHIRHAGA